MLVGLYRGVELPNLLLEHFHKFIQNSFDGPCPDLIYAGVSDVDHVKVHFDEDAVDLQLLSELGYHFGQLQQTLYHQVWQLRLTPSLCLQESDQSCEGESRLRVLQKSQHCSVACLENLFPLGFLLHNHIFQEQLGQEFCCEALDGLHL